ncbi:MAG: hypothetical protein JXK07_00225 [Spirochaetes bacterium]|nr:hypothetical protein [Spirochaetota bacterium]MBN2770903.1 hypothetical protein [Spirochaetota bacterium]
MAVSPIDLQTNMGHMHDVAKQAQSRAENLLNQHQFLDRESELESNRHKDRVDANRESDESRMESAKERESREKNKKKQDQTLKSTKKDDQDSDKPHDPLLGNNIDFTR